MHIYIHTPSEFLWPIIIIYRHMPIGSLFMAGVNLAVAVTLMFLSCVIRSVFLSFCFILPISLLCPSFLFLFDFCSHNLPHSQRALLFLILHFGFMYLIDKSWRNVHWCSCAGWGYDMDLCCAKVEILHTQSKLSLSEATGKPHGSWSRVIDLHSAGLK